MNNTSEHLIIIQQIALNNKMFENGHIEKLTHAKAHNVLISNLTNLASQNMISKDDLISHSNTIQSEDVHTDVELRVRAFGVV